jgi:hypothetical protein
MATLKMSKTDLVLTKKEQAAIQRDLRDLVTQNSKARDAELDRKFRYRQRNGNLLAPQLEEDQLRQLRRHYLRERDVLQREWTKSVKKHSVPKRKRPGRPKAVWGLTSGSETPTYDMEWEFRDEEALGAVTSGLPFTADPATGRLNVVCHCEGRPKMMHSCAGVGFWYIPNRSGVLNISIAPSLGEDIWTIAEWNDVGAAGGWIGLGIASYLRDPFHLVEWNITDKDRLWWNEDNWYDSSRHTRNRTAYAMNVDTRVDTAHYYACWAWIEAYAYAQNGGGMAQSHVWAHVRSFTYSLL